MRTIILFSLTATLTTVMCAATPPTIRTPEPSEIGQLNDCIQIRFLDRKAFGMMRIAPTASHNGNRLFLPENPTEQSVVDRLKEKGLEVAVFLVGRQALTPFANVGRRAGLQGPASITLLRDSQLPDEAALLAEGKTALDKIGQSRGYDFKSEDWSIAVRPLRASNQTCSQCHDAKVGDALGVAMYVYRSITASSR